MSNLDIPCKVLDWSESMTVQSHKDLRESAGNVFPAREMVANESGRTLLTARLHPTKSLIYDSRHDIQVQPVDKVGVYTSRQVDTSSGRDLYGGTFKERDLQSTSIWPESKVENDSIMKTQSVKSMGSGRSIPELDSGLLTVRNICFKPIVESKKEVKLGRKHGRSRPVLCSTAGNVLEDKKGGIAQSDHSLKLASDVLKTNLSLKMQSVSSHIAENSGSSHRIPGALRGIEGIMKSDSESERRLQKLSSLLSVGGNNDDSQSNNSEYNVKTVNTGASGVLLQRDEELDVQVYEQSKDSVRSQDIEHENDHKMTQHMANLLRIGFVRAPKLPEPSKPAKSKKQYINTDKGTFGPRPPRNQRALRRQLLPQRLPSQQSKENMQYLLPILRATRPQSPFCEKNPDFSGSIEKPPASAAESEESSVPLTPVVADHIVTTITELGMDAMFLDDGEFDGEFTLAQQFQEMQDGEEYSQHQSPLGPDRPPSYDQEGSMGQPATFAMVPNNETVIYTSQNVDNGVVAYRNQPENQVVIENPVATTIKDSISNSNSTATGTTKSKFQHYPDYLYMLTPLAMEVGHGEKTLHSFHPHTTEKQRVYKLWQQCQVTFAFISCEQNTAVNTPAFRDKMIQTVRRLLPLSMMRLAKALMQVPPEMCEGHILTHAHSLGLQLFLLGSSIPTQKIARSDENTTALLAILDCISNTVLSSQRQAVAPFVPYDVLSKVVSNSKTDTDFGVARMAGLKQHVANQRKQQKQAYTRRLGKQTNKNDSHSLFYCLEGVLERSDDVDDVTDHVQNEKHVIEAKVAETDVPFIREPLLLEPFSVNKSYNAQCIELSGHIELRVKEIEKAKARINLKSRQLGYQQDALSDEKKLAGKQQESLHFLSVNYSSNIRSIAQLGEDIEGLETELASLQEIGVVLHAAQGRNTHIHMNEVETRDASKDSAMEEQQWSVNGDVLPLRLNGEILMSNKVKRQLYVNSRHEEYITGVRRAVELEMALVKEQVVPGNTIDSSQERSTEELQQEYARIIKETRLPKRRVRR